MNHPSSIHSAKAYSQEHIDRAQQKGVKLANWVLMPTLWESVYLGEILGESIDGFGRIEQLNIFLGSWYKGLGPKFNGFQKPAPNEFGRVS